jgi:hypothetical protein
MMESVSRLKVTVLCLASCSWSFEHLIACECNVTVVLSWEMHVDKVMMCSRRLQIIV